MVVIKIEITFLTILLIVVSSITMNDTMCQFNALCSALDNNRFNYNTSSNNSVYIITGDCNTQKLQIKCKNNGFVVFLLSDHTFLRNKCTDYNKSAGISSQGEWLFKDFKDIDSVLKEVQKIKSIGNYKHQSINYFY